MNCRAEIRSAASSGRTRRGSSNSLLLLIIGSLAVLVLLFFLLPGQRKRQGSADRESGKRSSTGAESGDGNLARGDGDDSSELFMYCAAGIRYAMEDIVADYKREYGVSVQLQYGGSNTLLNQLDVSRTGDLYLAADDTYMQLAAQKGLIAEVIPLALMKPVIAVRRDNSKNIRGIDDLLRDDVTVALGDPDAAAVGKIMRKLLAASDHWERLQKRATASGVFKPTVNEIANAVQLGGVDAGIVWDSTAAQYSDVTAIEVPELNAGLATIEIAVATDSKSPTTALHFARYVAARDKGLEAFRAAGFETLDGDPWHEHPELTFFAGAVNREALESIIADFERREGVTVNAVFNGCGILNATMRGIADGQSGSFPDVYMACDRYYLETVDELFEDVVDVSDTDIVIVTAKGNPKGIRSLADLLKAGVRVVLGEPDKCTIGVLARRLLQSESLYERLQASGNLVNQTTSSALLVPQVATGAADVVLAYRTDTRGESNRLEVIDIESPLAKAVQPFGFSRSSDQKQLSKRLFARIADSRDRFESRGFHWRLGNPLDESTDPAISSATAAESNDGDTASESE